jgi:hypothetical protein
MQILLFFTERQAWRFFYYTRDGLNKAIATKCQGCLRALQTSSASELRLGLGISRQSIIIRETTNVNDGEAMIAWTEPQLSQQGLASFWPMHNLETTHPHLELRCGRPHCAHRLEKAGFLSIRQGSDGPQKSGYVSVLLQGVVSSPSAF